jgi:hypothetical protein
VKRGDRQETQVHTVVCESMVTKMATLRNFEVMSDKLYIYIYRERERERERERTHA